MRSRLWRWDDVQANNKLEEPDSALPSYEGLDETVEGNLVVDDVDLPQFGIRYRRYLIGGREVEPPGG